MSAKKAANLFRIYCFMCRCGAAGYSVSMLSVKPELEQAFNQLCSDDYLRSEASALSCDTSPYCNRSRINHQMDPILMKSMAVEFVRRFASTKIKIGKRRVGKECRSRWSPYH